VSAGGELQLAARYYESQLRILVQSTRQARQFDKPLGVIGLRR